MEGIEKTEKPWKSWTEEVEDNGSKKVVYSGKRPEGLQEERVGNRGPQGTAVAEEEQEVG